MVATTLFFPSDNRLGLFKLTNGVSNVFVPKIDKMLVQSEQFGGSVPK